MATYKVIDVSDWQGKINWAKVKAAGIHGAIIRYADGTTLDKRFAENMTGAKKAGLHIGSYIFSRAKTIAEAQKEATRLYNACKSYGCDMPLYIDLEVAANSKYADIVAPAFLNKMKALGGRGGVYANLNWWNNYLTKTAKNYSASPFWIAQYNTKMTHKNPSLFGMWQYSSSGKVDGISGKVDMDECYIAYWSSSSKKTVSSRDQKIEGMKAWAKKMEALSKAGDLHYVKWDKNDIRTHLCPYCSIPTAMPSENVKNGSKGDDVIKVQKFLNWCMTRKLTVDGICGPATVKTIRAFQKEYGLINDGIFGPACIKKAKSIIKKFWGGNCIWGAFSCWHHGGGLKSKCNCHVIDNTTAAVKIFKAKTDAEALKIARDRIGIHDIQVIRNNGKMIPNDKLQAGDIGVCFKADGTAKHFVFYMGNGKIADCTSGRTPNFSASASLNTYQKNYPIKLAFRYIGE